MATLNGLATDVDCPTCPARKYVPCTHHDGRIKSPCEARVEKAYRAEVRRGEHDDPRSPFLHYFGPAGVSDTRPENAGTETSAKPSLGLGATGRRDGGERPASCTNCGCHAVRHAVDDEERRECLDCRCPQFEC